MCATCICMGGGFLLELLFVISHINFVLEFDGIIVKENVSSFEFQQYVTV